MTLIISAFLLGLTGSFHCVGMCGPLALAMPMTNGRNNGVSILSYLLGKTIVYTAFGGIFGLFGSRIVLAGFQQSLSIILGVLLLAITISLIFKRSWFHRGRFANWISNKLQPFFSKLLSSKSPFTPLGFGVLNGLLPCGLVYMGIIGAIASGSFYNGMLFMALFGIGTMPVMLIFLLLAKQFSFEVRHLLQKVSPYIIMLVGVLLIVRGLGLSIPFLSPGLSEAAFLEKAGSKIICHPN
jgi:sulfite exporter TauE/SafE